MIESYFTTIPILAKASKHTKETLLPYTRVEKYNKGEHLFLEKFKVEHIYFLIDGNASFYKLGSNQERKVIFIHKSGDILNEEAIDGKLTSVNCEFLVTSHVLCFDIHQFLYCCEHDFQLTKALMDAMSLRIRRLYHQMKNTVNSLTGDKKLAAKLWKLGRDHGSICREGIEINIPLSITYLADILGSKRETVSRQTKILVDKGLIIVERNRFVICNADNLLTYISLS